ncbi:hypothetical protein ACXU4B_12795 [Dyella soli]|uniref:DUF5666 domain-containing protein n=1 Tax=Dyella soli TaxID=522319 RepID=A0A4V2NL13_9GAMM|nr:hypothetical protein [Dyella soli]TCI06978.1 hypothetical protein EZM97_30645 [Dyella soli]
MNKLHYSRWYVLATAMAMTTPAYVLAQPQEAAHTSTVTSTAHELGREEATLTATVMKIDQATRMVTLRGPKGNEETIKAGPEVKNLDQVKVGDQVTAHYQRAAALEILPAKSAEAGVEYESGTTRAPKGSAPGGETGQSLSVTSKLTAVDLKNHTVTLTGEDGNPRVIEVKDPARQAKMKHLKVGDMVRVTYVEGLAVTVTPKAKAKP